MARPESSLDLPADELRELADRLSDLVTRYLADVGERPVFPAVSGGQVGEQLGTDLPLTAYPSRRCWAVRKPMWRVVRPPRRQARDGADPADRRRQSCASLVPSLPC